MKVGNSSKQEDTLEEALWSQLEIKVSQLELHLSSWRKAENEELGKTIIREQSAPKSLAEDSL
jgi:hypothetical protein